MHKEFCPYNQKLGFLSQLLTFVVNLQHPLFVGAVIDRECNGESSPDNSIMQYV
jgi:hypothetical protein